MNECVKAGIIVEDSYMLSCEQMLHSDVVGKFKKRRKKEEKKKKKKRSQNLICLKSEP